MPQLSMGLEKNKKPRWIAPPGPFAAEKPREASPKLLGVGLGLGLLGLVGLRLLALALGLGLGLGLGLRLLLGGEGGDGDGQREHGGKAQHDLVHWFSP